VGGPGTDLGRLRAAYKKGGAKAARAESTRQASAALATASGGQQLLGYVNHKSDAYHWVFYATVIYGTIRSDGTITEYGRYFTRDAITVSGDYAKFTFYADRTTGSALRFRLSNWFQITTGGGYWTDTPKVRLQSVFSGDPYYCNHSYLLYGDGGPYTGLGFYGKSRVTWWNQYSPNPSSADGSWTLTESHGPLDCKAGRPQRCQWR
jgi:hypothetical protein